MSLERGRTWIGLPAEDGPADLGQVRIERWQRQPHRTLLPSNTSHGKSGAGQRRLGPGLVAVAAVSKEPADGGVLCAGVRLTQAEKQRPAAWYCPCDVRITLVGERGDDLTRTVKWVMTPQNSEIFFHMLPLADVEKHHLSDSGALRIRAQIIFHFSVQPSSSMSAVFPLGAHGATLQALMYSRCLAGSLKSGGKANGGTHEQPNHGQLEVCRSGIMTKPATSSLQKASDTLLVPGLLPPCPELPSACAQEVIPGLMIASGEAMSKLVELHDVGVGTLLQVSMCLPRSVGSSKQVPEDTQLGFEVRMLELREAGDTVQLVQNPVCPSDEPQNACAVIDLIEEALQGVLSGKDVTSYMLVLPCEEPQDMEACAALVAVVVARCFKLTFSDAQKYVRTRWDVIISEAWAQHLSGEGQLLPAESWTPSISSPASDMQTKRLLDELCDTFKQGGSEMAVCNKFASWFDEAGASCVSYGRASSWDQAWEPCPGLCVRIYDSGWGSASEVLRAMSACNHQLKAPMIVLRMMSALPKGEIFEVPYRIDSGDDTWHLCSLVLTDAHTAGSAHPRCVSFLHGASLWLLDADGHLYEVSRQSHSSGAPENWLCTCDMSPRAIVYLRNSRPKGKLPAPSKSQVRPMRRISEEQEPVPETHLAVRIVTEKMLQQAEGDFRTSLDIAASTVLVLPRSTCYAELQERVHQSLKIPPDRQLLFHMPDDHADATEQRLFLVQDTSAVFAENESVTFLLMFAADPSIVSVDAPVTVSTGTRISLPSRLPLICKYFERSTLRYMVLGILLAAPGDSLLHHVDWIKKRIALLGGISQDQEPNADSSHTKGIAWLPALACCMKIGQPGMIVPVRMDWPLCEQQVCFGCTLTFESATCGRVMPMPAAKALEVCGGTGTLISALAQLVHPPPPVDLLGCVFFDSDVRAHRSKGRCSGEPDAWGLLHRMLSEALEDQLDIELVSVSKSSSAPTEHSSAIVFKIQLDGNMATAGDVAMEVCWCFATPETAHRRALCRGRFAKHRPWEFFVTAGSARGGARALWHAVAPGWSESPTPPSLRANSPIPGPLLSVLYASGVPLGDVEVFEIGPDTVDNPEQRAAGWADYNAATLLGPEGLLPPPSRRSRRKSLESQAEEELPTDSANCSTVDAGELGNSVEDVDTLAEQRPDTPIADIADGLGATTPEPDPGGCSPCRSAPPSQTAASVTSAYTRPKPEGLRLEDARLEIECRSFMLVGICYEGSRCKYAHPTGAQLARPDPCPFRFESRERCPMRICCAFSHGDGERQCPPYIRARGGSCEHSVSSTPGGATPAQQVPHFAGAHSPGPEECTATVVKRMLNSSIEQLAAVLAEAKALNLMDEIHEAEKQLLSLFLLRGATLPRRETVPRSSAMSRSSSCDSFLDEVAGRDAARLVLALTPGEATQPSTPRSLLHTPGPSPHPAWAESDVSENNAEITAEGSVLPPAAPLPPPMLATATGTTVTTPAVASSPMAAVPAVILPVAAVQSAAMPGTAPPSPVLTTASLPQTAPVSPAMVVPVLPAAALPAAMPPALPIVSWHEPILETSSPSMGASFADEYSYMEHGTNVNGGGFRTESDQQFSRPSRFDRRSSTGMIGGQTSMPNVGFMWHTSPFNISRTPNIRTPVSHCSPARSPTSFSGYCSPITALPSGVTSPTQRRSRSGYSSPSADRSHVGPTFFVGPGTATAQSGLMRRLMSLREAREEKDDDEWSNLEPAEKAEGKNLLDFLQEQSQSVSLNRRPRDPPSLCLDLSADFLPYCRRGLAPSRTAHCVNAFLQALLPCSPLMHLFAQLSWHSLTRQRPTYAFFVQIAFQFFGGNRLDGLFSDCLQGNQPSAAMLGPFDTWAYVDPILRRFERAKGSSAAAQPVKGPTETLAGFVHFLLSELHNECQWPMLSPNASQYEDSPINRIFGGLLRKGRSEEDAVDFGGLMDSDNADVEPFLVLHLDLTGEPCASVAEATHQNLLRGMGSIASGGFFRGVHAASHFERLPPFLLIHLQRFRTINGMPTRVSRHCHIDMRLELEEATHCTLRSVCYELCSLVCHYGEAPDGGTYKALARQGCRKSIGAGTTFPPAATGGPPSPFGGTSTGMASVAGVAAANTPGTVTGDWYVFDDTAVRLKPADELASVFQSEGYHVCFLMYRREDTKTINIRPHAL